jgi:hypothetical protein
MDHISDDQRKRSCSSVWVPAYRVVCVISGGITRPRWARRVLQSVVLGDHGC